MEPTDENVIERRRRRNISPYRRWQQEEEIPIYSGSYVEDLHTLEVAPWVRTGQQGAFVNLASQEIDDGQLSEIAPGGETRVQRHFFESLIYVVEGRGATTIWQTEGGPKQTVEWQRGSLFSPPLNCFYQHFNLDGSKPARLYAATTAPAAINLTRDTEFVFDAPYVFKSRYDGQENFFSDPGEHLARTEWRTNFIADLRTFELDPYPERGGGGVNMHFEIANNASRAHISQFQPGTYKKGHRHGAGAHVIVLDGVGYSLLWNDGSERKKIDWKDGAVVSPGHGEFHQHFNTGPEPAKYLALTFGNVVVVANDVEHQIEYEEEDPEIFALYERECGRHGATVKMPRPARV
jgi:quercetin dioxygenase-like cupin family protein